MPGETESLLPSTGNESMSFLPDARAKRYDDVYNNPQVKGKYKKRWEELNQIFCKLKHENWLAGEAVVLIKAAEALCKPNGDAVDHDEGKQSVDDAVKRTGLEALFEAHLNNKHWDQLRRTQTWQLMASHALSAECFSRIDAPAIFIFGLESMLMLVAMPHISVVLPLLLFMTVMVALACKNIGATLVKNYCARKVGEHAAEIQKTGKALQETLEQGSQKRMDEPGTSSTMTRPKLSSGADKSRGLLQTALTGVMGFFSRRATTHQDKGVELSPLPRSGATP